MIVDRDDFKRFRYFSEDARIALDSYVLGAGDTDGDRYFKPVPVTRSEQKVVHNPPMLSLEKVHDLDGVTSWISTCGDQIRTIYKSLSSPDADDLIDSSFDLTIEAKYDGIAVKVEYINGMCVGMSTRGTGILGEDISRHIPYIVNLRKQVRLPDHSQFELRGEVLLRAARLVEINTAMEKIGEEPYANTRNAVAGLMNRTELSVIRDAMRDGMIGLEFVVYGVIHSGASHGSACHLLEELATTCLVRTSNPVQYASTEIGEIEKALADYQEARDDGSAPFDMDGVVIKIDSLQLRQQMEKIDTRSPNRKYPRWAVAYKFPPRAEETTLLYIGPRVGRTGKITPVAYLDPTNIGGVRVSMASLHNFQFIREKGLCVGDRVRVARMGDVIPQVTHVVKSSGSEPLPPPANCPSCGSVLREDGANLFCTSRQRDCMDRALASLTHFVSRDACNIKGLAEETLESLYRAGIVKSPADLFCLDDVDVRRLLVIPRFSTASIKKLLRSISSVSSGITLADLIYALGIPHVGKSTAEELSRHFVSPSDWLAAMVDPDKLPGALYGIPLVGEKTISAMVEFFSDAENVDEVKRLLSRLELHASPPRPHISRGRVVFTGTLPVPRSVAERHAKDSGWEVANSVSSTASYVVAGNDPGDNKISAATEKQIPIVSWDEFFKLTLK